MAGPFELAPGVSAMLVSQGGTPEQDEQVIKVLQETWQQIPETHRKVIHAFYCNLHGGWPRILLGFPMRGEATGVAQAGGPGCGYMLRFVLPVFFQLLDRQDMGLVMAEELAHAYMHAIGHESHTKKPPNSDSSSPDFRADINAQENAMKGVLYSWPFVDRIAHEALCSRIEEKAKQLPKKG
jgi:hypothetical protein